jgi:hypothetical protein
MPDFNTQHFINCLYDDRVISLMGYLSEDLLRLTQRVEAWNKGMVANIYCSELTSIQLFNSNNKFGNHTIIIDDELVNAIIRKYSPKYLFGCIVVVSNPLGVIGIMGL